jgi:DNA-binding LacI/PurR family transcriptional regulator
MPGTGSAPADEASPPVRVTIAHVASRAGVSPTTVSHVLSGKRVVRASTRDIVMHTIDELGYRTTWPATFAHGSRT